MNNECHKLKVLGLGFALGMTWGLSMLILGWTSWLWDWGTGLVTVMSSLYLGYEPTFIGGVIGGIWGFFDCLIGGILIAWFYNMYCRCCCKS